MSVISVKSTMTFSVKTGSPPLRPRGPTPWRYRSHSIAMPMMRSSKGSVSLKWKSGSPLPMRLRWRLPNVYISLSSRPTTMNLMLSRGRDTFAFSGYAKLYDELCMILSYYAVTQSSGLDDANRRARGESFCGLQQHIGVLEYSICYYNLARAIAAARN